MKEKREELTAWCYSFFEEDCGLSVEEVDGHKNRYGCYDEINQRGFTEGVPKRSCISGRVYVLYLFERDDEEAIRIYNDFFKSNIKTYEEKIKEIELIKSKQEKYLERGITIREEYTWWER